MNSQLKAVQSKVRSGLFALSQVKNFCSWQIRLKIYNALIHSHLTYACGVWSFLGCTKEDLDILMKLQKKAVRLVEGARTNVHSEPLFKKFNIVKVSDFPLQSALVLKARKHLNLLPAGLAHLGESESSQHYLLRRDRVRRNDLPMFAIENKLLGLWQDHKLDFANTSCLTTAKKNIKKYINDRYQADCSIQNCGVCARTVGH